MVKVCFRCRKLIKEEEHHYDFVERYQGEIVKVDSAHKDCWDLFLKSVSDTTEAMGIVRGLKGSLTKMGLIEPEEIIIKWEVY